MRTQIRSLTSLRFFAAALVVAYHSAAQSSESMDPGPLLRFGYVGVSFFFLLSGVVLVWSAREHDSVAAFYRRRFARVWPLHALTFLAAALLALGGLIDHYGHPWTAPVNLLLLHAWIPDHAAIFSFNGLSWSLSDEAFFYAVFPLMYVVLRRMAPRVVIAAGFTWLMAGGIAAELTGLTWFVGTLPLYRVGEFCLGMTLGVLIKRGELPRLVAPASALVVLAASYTGLVVANRLSAGWLAERTWLAGLTMLPALLLVVAAFARRDLDGQTGWLTRAWMVRIGQWSFALYMVHDLMLRAGRPIMLEHRWTAALVALATVLVAALVYEFFERPLERRLKGGACAPHPEVRVTSQASH